MIHICKPEVISTYYRILPKYCRKFQKDEFSSWREAFEFGIKTCKEGFRVFRQETFTWYEPLNTELMKINKLGD